MPPHLERLAERWLSVARFGAVGISGMVVNQAVLAGSTELAGVHYLASAIVATQVSSSWNFAWIERWVFRRRAKSGTGVRERFAWFLLMNNLALMIRIPVLWALVSAIGLHYLIGNVITVLLLFIARYALADGWIWRVTRAVPPVAESEASVSGPHGTYAYNVVDLVRINSEVELPELEYFRTQAAESPDVIISTKRVGNWPSRHCRLSRLDDKLTYVEQLGALGANFHLRLGSPIVIEVSPLLAKSRHVLYTNVLEALLRFLLVARGHVLLHSAAVIVDGKALLLSAKTDTGKTSTIIKLVRERAYEFLSDDMTVVAPNGRAICYPKPMTLSYHTMAEISGKSLRRRQRAALAVQSRLHSKSGRTVGRFLGTLRIPIMSVNSLVQIFIPPPKYRIDALMESRIAREAPIGHVVVMERGEGQRRQLAQGIATQILIENTDDAYGFPPFATLAPRLEIDGMDYAQLRLREHELLTQALGQATLWRVRVPGHGWDEALADILAGPQRGALALSVGASADAQVPVSMELAGGVENEEVGYAS